MKRPTRERHGGPPAAAATAPKPEKIQFSAALESVNVKFVGVALFHERGKIELPPRRPSRGGPRGRSNDLHRLHRSIPLRSNALRPLHRSCPRRSNHPHRLDRSTPGGRSTSTAWMTPIEQAPASAAAAVDPADARHRKGRRPGGVSSQGDQTRVRVVPPARWHRGWTRSLDATARFTPRATLGAGLLLVARRVILDSLHADS